MDAKKRKNEMNTASKSFSKRLKTKKDESVDKSVGTSRNSDLVPITEMTSKKTPYPNGLSLLSYYDSDSD